MANLNTLGTELLKPSVLKEGHLLKLGRSMLKLPKLNYYVLKPSGVYWFTGKQENDILQGFIPLEDISLSLGTVVEASSQLHCIKLADKRKVHVLACHSMEIRNSWITAILSAVAHRLVNEPTTPVPKRPDSSSSSTDSEVFCDIQCPFTSPFWLNPDGQKRRTKVSRRSVPEVVPEKANWSSRNKKKKYRSKSLSLEDMHSIYSVAQQQPAAPRKRSVHDFTRHLLWPSSSKSTVDGDLDDTSKMRAAQFQNKASSKKRWSLFNIASFGIPHSDSGDRKQNGITKHESIHEHESSCISDTKL